LKHKKGNHAVHAVVVTYNPEYSELFSQILFLNPQVEKIWLIDNSSKIPFDKKLNALGLGGKVQLHSLAFNLGLGAAQNIGIKLAREKGATHVLILDQDSQPMVDMVKKLLNAIDELLSTGLSIAAVAPVYEDRIKGASSGFVRLGWFDYKKVYVSSKDDPLEVDFLISSGSLIPVEAFDVVGLIDEDLFIDHVDTEWCMRALSKGLKLFGVPSARMIHSLGNKRKRFWFLRWRNVPYHSPFRYYYMLRNGVLLQKRPYIPWKWRIGEFMRHWQMLLFFGFWGEGSFKRLAMMLRGLRDGIKGVQGPLRD
jgi:rhamnosyltransferase